MNLMLSRVSTRKFGRAVRLPEAGVPAAAGSGLSNSAVSRRFKALTEARQAEWRRGIRHKLRRDLQRQQRRNVEEQLVRL